MSRTSGGCIGFRVDGKKYISYSRHDHNTQNIRRNCVADIRKLMQKYSVDELREKIRQMHIVTPEEYKAGVTPEQKQKLEKYYGILTEWLYGGFPPGQNPATSWLAFLLGLHGDIAETIEVGYLMDAEEYMEGDPSIAYGYILNCDSDPKFDFYKRGKYIASFPASSIPDDWEEQLSKKVGFNFFEDGKR